MKRIVALLLTAALILSTCAALAAEYPGIILKKGMGGSSADPDVVDAISEMQERLAHYEFYEGNIDGKFGNGMYKAVKAFQTKNGLKVDGKIGQNTWDKLEADDSKSKSDPKYESLKKGDTGEKVKDLQRKLREKYYYGGTISGTFDSATETAVKSFQASTGLTADGIVGEKTNDELMNETAEIFQPGAIPRRTLKSGIRGYDVYLLQMKLIDLHFLDSSFANGFFGSATVSAVKKFQKENGLEENGTVTSTSRRYLWPTAIDQKEAEQDEEKSTEDDPYVRPTLRQGSSGNYVSNAQMRLKAAGFLMSKVDGIFGLTTKKAVIAFQKEKGLDADGVIGKETWKYLLMINVENAEQEVYEYYEGDEDKSKGVGGATTTLKYGSTGPKVVKLQEQLIALGYLSDIADGKFGVKTRSAVKALQKAHKLTVDGICGTKTYVKLYEELNENGISYE